MKLLKKILSEKYKRGIKEQLGVPSLHWSLLNLKLNGFSPTVVVDAGAYEGNWALDLLEVYPSAKVLMIEAQKNKEQILKKVTAKNNNVDYSISLLSSKSGLLKGFEESETASHVVENELGNVSYTLHTQTLDELLQQKSFPYPDLLKMDVQGHELEVLKGAEKSLHHSEVCLLEVTLLDLGHSFPLLAEILGFMDSKNFQAYDISQFIRRPFDKALYQMDMFFVKKDSDLLSVKQW